MNNLHFPMTLMMTDFFTFMSSMTFTMCFLLFCGKVFVFLLLICRKLSDISGYMLQFCCELFFPHLWFCLFIFECLMREASICNLYLWLTLLYHNLITLPVKNFNEYIYTMFLFKSFLYSKCEFHKYTMPTFKLID